MSSQARTQRSHRMQASWLTLITGLESSSPRPWPCGPPPADVDDAHPADADRVVAIVVAEDRDVDPGLLGGGVDGGALGHADLDAVDPAGDRLGGLRRNAEAHARTSGSRSADEKSSPRMRW